MAKSMFVKGWLIVCNKTCLTVLSVIIYKASHGDIWATPQENLLLHMRGQMRGFLAANQRLRFFAT